MNRGNIPNLDTYLTFHSLINILQKRFIGFSRRVPTVREEEEEEECRYWGAPPLSSVTKSGGGDKVMPQGISRRSSIPLQLVLSSAGTV